MTTIARLPVCTRLAVSPSLSTASVAAVLCPRVPMARRSSSRSKLTYLSTAVVGNRRGTMRRHTWTRSPAKRQLDHPCRNASACATIRYHPSQVSTLTHSRPCGGRTPAPSTYRLDRKQPTLSQLLILTHIRRSSWFMATGRDQTNTQRTLVR